MGRAQLTALTVRSFKSFDAATRLELAPLTIILGRNNSGKSSVIQSLLLLRQTLADPRPEVVIKLEGAVEAFNLRELTFGWPKSGDNVPGPEFRIEWKSEVDVIAALSIAQFPDPANLAKQSGVKWLREPPETRELSTTLTI